MTQKKEKVATVQLEEGTKILFKAKYGTRLRSDRLLGPYQELEIYCVRWPE